MIADERADALVSNFTGQWLQLRNLESKVTPDLLMFPDFDDNIRKGFRRETEMLFGNILRENRSALELLSADYTFLNERLAKHYGIPGVYGTRFRQVKLTDPNRCGLLGQGSILSLTSVATRTSPVFRGKYVLTHVPRTRRRRRRRRTCRRSRRATRTRRGAEDGARAARTAPQQPGRARRCHASSIRRASRSRTSTRSASGATATPNGAPIDAAGVLADGTKVDGPVALREAILSRPDAFATVVTERMLTYALGRGLEPADMPVVRRIVKKAAQNDYRFSIHRHGIVESAPFQMRTRAGAGRTDQHRRTSERIRSSHDHHEEAPVPPHVPARHLRRRGGAAVPRRDGAGADGAVADGGGAPFRFGAIYMPNGVYPGHLASGRRPAATSSSSR